MCRGAVVEDSHHILGTPKNYGQIFKYVYLFGHSLCFSLHFTVMCSNDVFFCVLFRRTLRQIFLHHIC